MKKLVLIGTVVALLVIPTSASADPPEVQINAQGTIGPLSSDEVIRFSVTARGSEASARGQIEIRTIVPGDFGHWSIHGTVVCISRDVPSAGFWQVRYRMTRSDFPVNDPQGPEPPHVSGLPGAYASFYVKDDPGGDWAGESTGTDDYGDDGCSFRGPPVFPLETGNIKVKTRP